VDFPISSSHRCESERRHRPIRRKETWGQCSARHRVAIESPCLYYRLQRHSNDCAQIERSDGQTRTTTTTTTTSNLDDRRQKWAFGDVQWRSCPSNPKVSTSTWCFLVVDFARLVKHEYRCRLNQCQQQLPVVLGQRFTNQQISLYVSCILSINHTT
jgi:hypothetical protein